MSSFSPDLRLELINTGDQAGVWGTTTNTNLGTLLESAVAGYTSVNIASASQALTTNDGAPDEARFAAIALTTGTSANFSVYLPPSPKQYVFKNTTAYVATIVNSDALGSTTPSGGTTVAIPAGKTVGLWTDGTNVAYQNDYTAAAVTTQAAKTADTTIASTAFADALRSLLSSSTTGGGTASISDRGSLISVSSGITIPAATFAAGDVFTICNTNTSSITITQGSGLTMYLVGTASTGNRTLAQKGLATAVFLSASSCILSGGGLS